MSHIKFFPQYFMLLIVDMKKVLVIWIENQTRHSTPLSQSLIKALCCAVLSHSVTSNS